MGMLGIKMQDNWWDAPYTKADVVTDNDWWKFIWNRDYSIFEACDEIRKLNPEVPALFMSGYSPEMLRQKGRLEDGEAMVSKPVVPQELLRRVRELLDGGK
jgi:CheY-like chemotaxis protein